MQDVDTWKENLEKENIKEKPVKAIIFFLLSLILILLLFALLFEETPGSGGGFGGGNGTGQGTGIGSGTGSGEGPGHGGGKGAGSGDGIGESNSNGLGQGDDGATDIPGQGGNGEEKQGSGVSNQESVADKPVEGKEEEGKLELPQKANWSPSAFKLGAKKNKNPVPPIKGPRTAGRGGGGGGGTIPMGTGDVSFRIYWEPKVHDIDLHVLDPNGHELWWDSKLCQCNGQLDVDDTKRGGPENIFWPKDQAPEGEYLYWVKYYQGAGPKTVTIQIRRDGKLTKTHKVKLIKWGDESKRFSLIHQKKK